MCLYLIFLSNKCIFVLKIVISNWLYGCAKGNRTLFCPTSLASPCSLASRVARLSLRTMQADALTMQANALTMHLNTLALQGIAFL